jgi:methanogenic corrinoid protein MtbC1
VTDQTNGCGSTIARIAAASDRGRNDEQDLPWSPADLARLERTIQADIIPRLLLAFGEDPAARPAPAPPRRSIGHADIVAFADLIVDREEEAAARFLQEKLADGVGVETVLLGLLAPAARHLGEEWESDRRSFVEVTVGLCRMQQLLRSLTPATPADAMASSGQRALFSPAPGEQHTFGLYVVEEFFRRDGWDVWTLASATVAEIEAAAASAWYDVAGFSLSGDLALSQLAQAIRCVRRASRNQGIRVLVGGRAFMQAPDRVAAVEADGTAEDGRQAVRCARELLRAAAI